MSFADPPPAVLARASRRGAPRGAGAGLAVVSGGEGDIKGEGVFEQGVFFILFSSCIGVFSVRSRLWVGRAERIFFGCV